MLPAILYTFLILLIQQIIKIYQKIPKLEFVQHHCKTSFECRIYILEKLRHLKQSLKVVLSYSVSVSLSLCLCVPKDLTNRWKDLILHCNVITIKSIRKILCRRYQGPPIRHHNILKSCKSVLLVFNIALRLLSYHVNKSSRCKF